MYTPQEEINQILKKLRTNQNLTQEELAQKVSKRRCYIGRIKSKMEKTSKTSTLVKIVEKGFEGKIIIEL